MISRNELIRDSDTVVTQRDICQCVYCSTKIESLSRRLEEQNYPCDFHTPESLHIECPDCERMLHDAELVVPPGDIDSMRSESRKQLYRRVLVLLDKTLGAHAGIGVLKYTNQGHADLYERASSLADNYTTHHGESWEPRFSIESPVDLLDACVYSSSEYGGRFQLFGSSGLKRVNGNFEHNQTRNMRIFGVEESGRVSHETAFSWFENGDVYRVYPPQHEVEEIFNS